MNIYKITTLLIALSISFSFSSPAAIDNNFDKKTSIEFFMSNNTNKIDLQTAFNRLKGAEQQQLQNEVINLMQKDHIEQGKFENILGTYQIVNDQSIAVENSEIFIASPYQNYHQKKLLVWQEN